MPKHEDKIQRPIYNIINIGHNEPRDTYDSVMFNTSGNPIQLMGIDQNGNRILGIPAEVMEKMQIKSMEQIDALLVDYNKRKNYCPFIKSNARCSIYSERPPICREFGTSPEPINKCPEKASRLEIAKFYIKDFFDFKGTFRLVKSMLKEKFAKG